MKSTLLVVSCVAAVCWMTAAACGSSDETATTATGVAGQGQGNNGSGGFGFGGGMSAGGSGVGGSCAGSSEVADPVPLDIYVMLDASGSMTDKTGTMGQGVEKWQAVTSALSGFFADPKSAGIGVALQFFPLEDPAAPATCTSSAQCGQFGPCVLKICSQSGFVCDSNNDCTGGQDQCINLGQCANNPSNLCLPIGAFCPGMQGQCVQVTTSFCLGSDSCNAVDYAMPAVPMAALNGNATALDAATAARTPEGATPTSAALQGALDFATAHAAANPDHKVVVVMATDGLPTSCDPTDAAGISQIAAAGLASAPSVPTFVIGVFSGNDMAAQMTMDQIAAAGGTNQAFIVDQGGNVETAFAAALDAIRGTSLACEYLIPQPRQGETIAYDHINVEHTPGGQTSPDTILYVGDSANCDPVTGGWYYDVDPNQGTPTKILVCDATCQVFQTGGQVDIRVGCETVIAPPN